MNNKFTLFLVALTVVATGIFASVDADAAKRKVVLEDHTGAWCGWCPRGMETLESLEDQYGDMVIGVGVHNGDGMTVASYQTPLAQAMGVTGYPNGTVNRVTYGGKIAQSDNVWNTIAQSIINTEVPVGVDLDVVYDKVTGDFTATVTAIVESEVNAPLTFNLWLLEEYMKGTGSQWDQANYLANRPGFESSKYFNEPNPIVGFEHNDVFRHAMAGINGETGNFPTGNTTPAGTYTQVYTGNVKDLNVDDSFNAYFVAVVSNSTNKEIINADRAGRPDYTMEVAAPAVTVDASNIYSFVESGKTGDHVVPIKSNYGQEADYEIRLMEGNSLIPNGWEVNYDKNVTIAANGTVDINVNVDSKGNKGMATLQFRVYPRVPDAKNWKSNFTIASLAEGTKHAYFASSDNSSNVVIYDLNQSSLFQGSAIVPFSLAQFATFDPNFSDRFETVVFTVDEASFVGFAPPQVSGNLTVMKNMAANGTDMLIVSTLDLMSYGESATLNAQFHATAEAKTWFKDVLGVDFGVDKALLVNNQLSGLPTVGVAGDPISSGVQFTANADYSGAFPFYAQRYATMSLNGNTNATAFLEASNPVAPLTSNNNKLGIKVENGDQRTIFMGLALESIPTAVRTDLVHNMISWLMEEAVAGPTISLNVSDVKFGTVEEGKSATEAVRINNNGTGDLTISEVSFKTGTMFSVNASFPMTIEEGGSTNLEVTFMPSTNGEFTDEMSIMSNATNNTNMTVPLSGKTSTTSVDGIISGLFEMKMVPNPVVDNSQIELQVNQSANVTLELIDATGKSFGVFYNETTTGDSFDFNSSELTSGTYYINANVDGKTTQLPVVITK